MFLTKNQALTDVSGPQKGPLIAHLRAKTTGQWHDFNGPGNGLLGAQIAVGACEAGASDDRRGPGRSMYCGTNSGVKVQTPGMNLLFLSDSFPPHAGGSRVYYYHLYRHLTEQFPDKVTVLTKIVPGWQEFDRLSSTESLRIIRQFRPLPDWKYYQLPRLLPPLAQAFRFVASHPVDLVHAGDLFPQGVIAMWLKRVFGVPYFAYSHGEEITQTDRCRYQPRVRDAIYRSADAVIAANEFALQNLIRIGIPKDNIFKITPGVDSELFSPRLSSTALAQRLRLEGKTVFLSVGRLVARKGHDRVLQVLSRLRHSAPRFHYLIVGEGPERDAIVSRVNELGLSDTVTLLGKLADQQLAEVYSACDIFVLANREVAGDLEGFGMVFLEANAAGKPVVGGRTGGTSEAVVENTTGLLVNPENVGELAAALERLLFNPDLRYRLGDAGRRRAVAQFSWPG